MYNIILCILKMAQDDMTTMYNTKHTKEELDQIVKNSVIFSKLTESIINMLCSVQTGPFPEHEPELKEYSIQLLNNTYIEMNEKVPNLADRIELLQSMIFRYPNNYTIYLKLGICYYNIGKLIEARTFFRYTLLLNKHNITALCHLAMIYSICNTSYSIKIFSKVLELTENDDSPDIRDIINNVRSALNKTEQKSERLILDEYIIDIVLGSEIEHDQLRPVKKEQQALPAGIAQALGTKIADISMRLTKYSNNAEHELEKMAVLEVLFYEPWNLSALMAMAGIYEKLKKPMLSMSYLLMILVIDPVNKDALVHLGLSFRNTCKEWSLKILQRANSLYSMDPSICNNLAVLYNDNNKYNESKELLLNLIKYGKLEDNTTKISVLCNLSTVCGCLSQNGLSIEYSNEALKLADKICANGGGSKNIGINAMHTKLMSYNNRLYDQDMVYKEHLGINQYFTYVERYHPVKYTKGSCHVGDGRIKIAYMSSDIKNHVVSKFMIDLARSHDRSKFEVYMLLICKQIDCIAEVYKKDVDHMIILPDTDTEAAKMINTAGIHILIELNGHTCDNRIAILAHKPAPIQVSYLGYPNTTGLNEIDYRITDSVADPIDSCQKYSEKLVRLPGCFLLYNPLIFNPIQGFGVIGVNANKSADRDIILGAINRPAKNHRALLALWGQILKRTSSKVKILFKMKSSCDVAEEITKFAKYLSLEEAEGKERIIVLEYQASNDKYIELFNKIDITMDTMPYSGTTTTCDSLYMSTPVITRYNKDYHAHNVTSSILTACGHSELIAYTDEEYIDKIVGLAGDIERINNYKDTLRSDFLSVQNPTEFTRKFEQSLVDML